MLPFPPPQNTLKNKIFQFERQGPGWDNSHQSLEDVFNDVFKYMCIISISLNRVPGAQTVSDALRNINLVELVLGLVAFRGPRTPRPCVIEDRGDGEDYGIERGSRTESESGVSKTLFIMNNR